MKRLFNKFFRYYTIVIFILRVVQPLRLAYYIYKHDLYGNSDTLNILKVMLRYIELNKKYLPENLVKYRDVDQSYNLLASLIDSYSNSHSSYKLGQIMTVLKEDFIERSKYSDK